MKSKKKIIVWMLVMFLMAATFVFPGKTNIYAADTDHSGLGNVVADIKTDPKTNIPTHEEAASGAGAFGKPEGNGRIWVDKSVTDKGNGSFDIGLSALTQEYLSTVTSYTTSSIAADVVFVLDGSGSMSESGSEDIADGSRGFYNRFQAMIKVTNEAIDIIMKANKENRVAIYIYSSTGSTEILKMDSYFTGDGSNQYLKWGGDILPFLKGGVGLGATLQYADGTPVPPVGRDTDLNHIIFDGATPTQLGVVSSIEKAIVEINGTTEDIKERNPYVFLLSDGGATYGNEKWWDTNAVTTNPTSIGDGGEKNSDTLAKITSCTILSASYMKDQLTEAYKNYNLSHGYSSKETKFYTLGLGNDINGPYVNNTEPDESKKILKYAWAGLNPSDIKRAGTEAIDESWNSLPNKADYIAATGNTASNVKNWITQYYQDALNNGQVFTKDYSQQENYEYAYYYQYANSYALLNEAFGKLANDVASATKTIKSPVEEEEIKGTKASIHFSDPIGEGMYVNETSPIKISGLSGNGELIGIKDPSSTENLSVYTFEKLSGKVTITKNPDGTQVVEWFMTSKDLANCLRKIITTGGYTDETPLVLSYNVLLKEGAINSAQKTFYTNSFTQTPGVKTADTVVTYTPSNDNTYYYYTNAKVGVVDNLINVGYPTNDTNIEHYIKGTKVGTTTGTLSNVYITTDMAVAEDCPEFITFDDIGKVIPSLTIDSATPLFNAMLQNSIYNCVVASAADTTSLETIFAFKSGIGKPHEHTVSKAPNATDTASLLSIEHFDEGNNNGVVTMTLGNNGRVMFNYGIALIADRDKKAPGGNITYTITVTNYTDSDSGNIKVEDLIPTGLTNITNMTDASVRANFTVNGQKAVFSDVNVPKNSSIELKINATVPTNSTVNEYKNSAKITDIGSGELTTPAVSNEVTTAIVGQVLVTVYKDDALWNDHGLNLFLVNKSDITKKYPLTSLIPDGTYIIYDDSLSLGKEVVVDRGSVNAVLEYYTLELTKGTGIDAIQDNSGLSIPGLADGQYIFLKGQTAKVKADVSTGYVFKNWVNSGTTDEIGTTASMDIIINNKTQLTANANKQGGNITINATLDDAPWGAFNKIVTLVDTAGNSYSDMTNVPKGNYTVYIDGSKTNITTSVDGTNQTINLDYYSFILNTGSNITSVTGAGTYLKGTTVHYGAFVAAGNTFTQWIDNLGTVISNNANDVIVIDSAIELTASANPPAKVGVNVVINSQLNDLPWNDSGKDIYLMDNNGHRVTDLSDVRAGTYTIYDGSVTTGKTVIVTPEDVTAQTDKSITLNYYELSLNTSLGIDSVAETNGNFIFLAGNQASIKAIVKDHYQFIGWEDASGNLLSNQESTLLTINQKLTLTAKAKKNNEALVQIKLDYHPWDDFDVTRLTLQAQDGTIITDLSNVPDGLYTVLLDNQTTDKTIAFNQANEILSLDFFTLQLHLGTGIQNVIGAGIYLSGMSAHIDALLNDGYTFSNWSGDLSLTTQQNTIVVNQPLTLTANAIKDSTTAHLNITINKDDSVWTDFNQTITLKSEDGTIITDLTQVPNGKYVVYINDISTKKEVIMNGLDASLILNYYSLTLDKAEGIKATSGSGIYLEGASINIEATVMDGYQFTFWNGDYSFNTSNVIISMNGTIHLTANAQMIANTDTTPNDKINTSDSTQVNTGDNTKTTSLSYVMLLTVSCFIGIVLAGQELIKLRKSIRK